MGKREVLLNCQRCGKEAEVVELESLPPQYLVRCKDRKAMNDFMEQARELAAQCWCDEETKHTVMEPALAEAVAKRIAAWMKTAAQAQRNEEFYRDLIRQIGEMFGDAAKTSDDGSLQHDVLGLRVPELVQKLVSHVRTSVSIGEAE